MMLDYLLGVGSALVCVWVGFYLARLSPSDSPTVDVPRVYEGEVLDSAVYPADEE